MVDILNKLIKGYLENENYIIENYTLEERMNILNNLMTFTEIEKIENYEIFEDEKIYSKFFVPEEALNLLMSKEVIAANDIVDGTLLRSLDDFGIKQILDTKTLDSTLTIKLIDNIQDEKLKVEYIKKYSSYYDRIKLGYIIKEIENDDNKINLIEFFNDKSLFGLFSNIRDINKKLIVFYKYGDYDKIAQELEKVNDDDFIIEWLDKIHKNIGSDVIEKLINKIKDEDKKIDILLKVFKKSIFFNLYCKSILNSITKEDSILKFFIEKTDADLIASLKNDNFKKMLIEKLGYKLNNNEIISIVKTIDDDDYKIKLISDYIEIDSYSICGIISTLKDDDKKISLAHYYEGQLTIDYIALILSSIKDDNKKIKVLDDFKNLQMNNREFIINSIKNPELKLSVIVYEGLSKQNFGWLKEQIEHNDSIINCKTVNYALLKWYSDENNVNLENLCIFVEKYGYMILRFLDNQNIKNILNSDREIFNKFLELFDDDCLNLNNSVVDSVYDATTQRIFRNNNIDGVFDLFNTLKELVYINDKENLLMRLTYLKLNDLKTFNGSAHELTLNLLNKETREESFEILKTIVDEYIIKKRNEYVNIRKKNIHNDIKIKLKLNKKEFIEKFLLNETEDIIQKINSIEEFLDVNGKNLLSNKSLLIECIKFKKNPKNYEGDFNNIKKYLKIFNDILDIAAQKLNDGVNLKNVFYESSNYELYIYNLESEYLLKIMSEIDINQLKDYLFTDENLYRELLKILKKSKIIGWGDTFEKLLDEAGISFDSSLVAHFISHFYKFYPLLQKKLENGEQKNISILSLIDEANTYSSSSNIYKILLEMEDYNLICKNPYPNAAYASKDERLKEIPNYIVSMYNRKYVTVPSIDETIKIDNKKSLNVVIGNVTDTINLTYGERTKSCMRIYGQGMTLFDFCLENENGFHVRITDPSTGEFVSRVSGFRNGNTVILNQLRYSEMPNKYSNNDLVLLVKKVASLLIEKTKDSKYPIENVIISSEYAMEGHGEECFVDKVLTEGLGYFYTDTKGSNIIVLASINPDNSLSEIKLGSDNAEKYEVLRSKPKFTTEKKEISKEINKLLLIKHLLDGKKESYFATRQIDFNYDKLYYGEDWYIVLDANNKIIEEFYIDRGDRRALDEINEVKQIILNNQSDNGEGGLKL